MINTIYDQLPFQRRNAKSEGELQEIAGRSSGGDKRGGKRDRTIEVGFTNDLASRPRALLPTIITGTGCDITKRYTEFLTTA